MSTAFEFLKANKVFMVGTSDATKGRVRPFAFVMKRNDTAYFCTGKGKDVYKQMTQYPDIESVRWALTTRGSECAAQSSSTIAATRRPRLSPKRLSL